MLFRKKKQDNITKESWLKVEHNERSVLVQPVWTAASPETYHQGESVFLSPMPSAPIIDSSFIPPKSPLAPPFGKGG